MDADRREVAHARRLGRQGQPFAGAVGGELRHVERAVVEQGRGVAALGVGSVRDVAIQELAALVVAHVDHHAVVGRQRHRRVLVLEAAERGALHRGALGIRRVDLDDVAEAVGLVRLRRHVEAGIVLLVGVAALGADAVPLEALGQRRGGVGRPEVAVEVLLAGQIRAPERLARPAVVQRAEHGRAVRIGAGPEQRVARGGPGQRHRRAVGDPAVEGTVDNDRPAGVRLGYFHHRDALEVHQLRGVLGAVHDAGGFAGGGGQVDLLVHVLMVHGDDLPAVDLEQLHAVGVLAEHPVGGRRVAAVRRIPGGRVREQRIAPAHQHAPVVAFGHVNGEVCLDADGHEGEARRRLRLRRGRPHEVQRGRRGPEGQHARHEPATRHGRGDHLVEIGGLRGGAAQLVPVVPAQVARVGIFHGGLPGSCCCRMPRTDAP